MCRYIASFVDQRNTVDIKSIAVNAMKITGSRPAALKPVESVPMLFRTCAGFHGFL
jgi:hypothetical protein